MESPESMRNPSAAPAHCSFPDFPGSPQLLKDGGELYIHGRCVTDLMRHLSQAGSRACERDQDIRSATKRQSCKPLGWMSAAYNIMPSLTAMHLTFCSSAYRRVCSSAASTARRFHARAPGRFTSMMRYLIPRRVKRRSAYPTWLLISESDQSSTKVSRSSNMFSATFSTVPYRCCCINRSLRLWLKVGQLERIRSTP